VDGKSVQTVEGLARRDIGYLVEVDAPRHASACGNARGLCKLDPG
jgi:hypothetical protein